jgi:hypothetical protein
MRNQEGKIVFVRVAPLEVKTYLGPTQPPIQWVPEAISLGVKLTTHLHLVRRSKNAWSYTSTPPIRFYGVVLG